MATTLTNTDIRASYIPEMYSPILKENMRDALMLSRITNTEFQGKFRNKGDTIIVRKTPLIGTKKYVDEQHIAYEDPNAQDERFTINRARYYAFRVHDINQALSDIPNFAGTWTKEGARQLAEDIEDEFFQDVYAQCDPYNKGNTAGRISGNYQLGTSADPLFLYKTQAQADADTTASRKKAAVVDALAAACGVLDEQKGGKNARPWIIIPSAVAVRIQTSELKDASMTGDSKSTIRLGVESIGSIAGMDIYRSNLIPKLDTNKFVCLFGDNSAITFANEISKTEMLRDTDSFSDLHRSLCVYDWFVRWPERFGHLVVSLG